MLTLKLCYCVKIVTSDQVDISPHACFIIGFYILLLAEVLALDSGTEWVKYTAAAREWREARSMREKLLLCK